MVLSKLWRGKQVYMKYMPGIYTMYIQMFNIRLRTSNIPIRFVTNTTKESGQTLYSRLRRIGFELDKDEIYSSLNAARNYVIRNNLRPFYLLTSDARSDFPQTDRADDDNNAVVVGLAPEMYNYDVLNRSFK